MVHAAAACACCLEIVLASVACESEREQHSSMDALGLQPPFVELVGYQLPHGEGTSLPQYLNFTTVVSVAIDKAANTHSCS